MIFCLSQLHTGTQTTIGWLKSHKDVEGLMLSTGVWKEFGPPSETAIVHQWRSGSYEERFNEGMVYHEHVRGDHQDPSKMNRTQLILSSIWPTVIPIRDPLLCLISYQHRGEVEGRIGTSGFKPHEHILDRWCMMAEFYSHLKQMGVQFICWDRGDPGHLELEMVARHLGIPDTFNDRFGTNLIHNNSLGIFPLKKAYFEGDVKWLEDRLHDDLFNSLRCRELTLRPMLEDLGYTKLLWWS